ncbi:Clavaminate synthase-like protein [Lentinus tigrinus ALCF2SS1-7]|uniref:Clavaminate synthase-like protein n=1 Tax=Lentinus tigrinus ALCF2SS1-6 TaxID=1328759 RepID=A0A5C2S1L4_9APHY|nr:Clavaminate synthase-like protein [Lentinus tigrinus ALCF2SS1-6]RPD71665.1 Clavaminate synthase-like protein [Lentinus tigrinus ALCF2SS1-7]
MSLVQAAHEAESAEAFKHIPIIDLKDVSNPDPQVRKALGDQVRDACMNVGFLYVKNHGIPEENISKALQASKEFFSLPLEKKMELDITKTANFKGYNPILSSNNDPENRGDLHEGFEFGWEELDARANDEKRANDGAMAGANVWPADTPEFRESVLGYYHAAVDLGRKLFPLFALALDLPENFFEDKTKNAAAIMRVLHYPPQTGPVDDRVIGIGAHTDFECFTILWQEPGIQALQVLNKQKQWIDAPPIPGTLVVNLGDQFARWTNDVFKSTVHRAINRSGVRRYSIPLFFGTDYDVKLEPIPSCVSPDRPPKYEVVTAGDYVKERLKATYGH